MSGRTATQLLKDRSSGISDPHAFFALIRLDSKISLATLFLKTIRLLWEHKSRRSHTSLCESGILMGQTRCAFEFVPAFASTLRLPELGLLGSRKHRGRIGKRRGVNLIPVSDLLDSHARPQACRLLTYVMKVHGTHSSVLF